MSEKNKAILEEANIAVAEGDYEKFLSFCSEDTEWTFIGDQILKGKEAVRRWMAAEYIEPPVNVVAHLVAEGEFVTAIGNIMTKDQGGRENRFAYCDVWRFQDGKMVELKAFVIAADNDHKSDGAIFNTSFGEKSENF